MNTWFQFQQFIIHQEKCAMKVCTDACLFGAWVAKNLEENKISAEHILDIGCGTGVLSLMLAQKSEAKIDAVEIDDIAFQQAKENINLSVWSERISIHKSSIINYISSKKYDLIISNPPFYENQLKSESNERNKAMHDITLSYKELAVSIKKNLNKNGYAAILLPYSAVRKFEDIMSTMRLFVSEKFNVAHSPNHLPFRNILLFSAKTHAITEHLLTIKNLDKEYSKNFKELLKDYYLHL